MMPKLLRPRSTRRALLTTTVIVAVACIVMLLILIAYMWNGPMQALPLRSRPISSWLLNKPKDFQQTTMKNGGKEMQRMYDMSLRGWHMQVNLDASDNEVFDAMRLLFYGKKDGVSLEIGALDGTMVTRCETQELENFHWQRVLVEANPAFRSRLALLDTAFTANAAICDSQQTMHYVTGRMPFVNGIVEFMHHDFLKKFHPWLVPIVRTKAWSNPLPKSVTEIQCLPMKSVLKETGISHFNLWVLDTEGSELSILQTVDWNAVVFDVIIVESKREMRREGYAEQVMEYLVARGYVLMTLAKGRNSWYRHKSFVNATKAPYVKPELNFLHNVIYS